ncbi:MAG: UPF0280 family protein [Candidatus Omnitrophota bacterium]
MKSARYQRRFYRDWIKPSELYLTQVIAKETDVEILTNKPLDAKLAEEKIRRYRWEVENYITKDSRFLVSLKPLNVELNAPAIVKEMSKQTQKVNVGPMASVAGAIAEFLGKELLKHGYKEVIVENGGDIFLKVARVRKVGFYAGRSKTWDKLGLKIAPKDTPLGICTSSGTIGHSLSFGSADSVVILAKSATLADAVATATCNRVNSKADLQKALDFAKSIPGVSGAVIIMKNNLISWGRVEFAD